MGGRQSTAGLPHHSPGMFRPGLVGGEPEGKWRGRCAVEMQLATGAAQGGQNQLRIRLISRQPATSAAIDHGGGPPGRKLRGPDDLAHPPERGGRLIQRDSQGGRGWPSGKGRGGRFPDQPGGIPTPAHRQRMVRMLAQAIQIGFPAQQVPKGFAGRSFRGLAAREKGQERPQRRGLRAGRGPREFHDERGGPGSRKSSTGEVRLDQGRRVGTCQETFGLLAELKPQLLQGRPSSPLVPFGQTQADDRQRDDQKQ
ncbi:MAG: hypothetical protein OZSIB_0867 [Candidatus Ozemobacter sibiricus]|uniref:Uncharacterized protein n=1 Tax=Candidatus Ozemobacter sibiricus TaxID=2268124 RepID=A0A367ZUA9_9BACT|nr:MAG: hypothetical protein OZSIB_0867 [Candidatus Ozemobacter sibiricus]